MPKCRNCGKEIRVETVVCPFCSSRAGRHKSGDLFKSPRQLLILGIVVAVVSGATAFYLFSNTPGGDSLPLAAKIKNAKAASAAEIKQVREAYPGDDLLGLAEQSNPCGRAEVSSKARKGVSEILDALGLANETRASFEKIVPKKVVCDTKPVKVTYLDNQLVISGAETDIAFANDSIIISSGPLHLSHSSNNVIICGSDVDIAHDGAMGKPSLIISKGTIKISGSAKNTLIYAVGGGDLSYAQNVRAFNTHECRAATGDVASSSTKALFRDEATGRLPKKPDAPAPRAADNTPDPINRNPSLEARLSSCDPVVVHKAAEEMLHDTKTLKQPLELFTAAMGERMIGHKEEAAFFYLAGRLRTSRQALFEKGDIPQLLTVMNMTVGPLVMPDLQTDPSSARTIVRRVIDWDHSTPDPYRDSQEAKTGDMQKKLLEIDKGLERLPDQMPNTPSLISKAREAAARAESQINAMKAERCGPGSLDPVDKDTATRFITSQVENFVKTHPFVLKKANGVVKSVNVGAIKHGKSGLPSRLTVSVESAGGKRFYAEVDADVTITPDHKLGPVTTSLACITELWVGQRGAFWKDVCRDDPNAMRP